MAEEICGNIPHKENREIVDFITNRMRSYNKSGIPSRIEDETGHPPEKLAEHIVKETQSNMPADKLKAELDKEIERIKKMDKNGSGIVSMAEYLNSECTAHQESLTNIPQLTNLPPAPPPMELSRPSPINGTKMWRM